MSCNCNNTINSWYDLQNASPKNPFELIAYAALDGTIGVFEYSSDFLNPGGIWTDTPITFDTTPAICGAWETDNQQMVADALMWTQQHLIINPAPDIALPLRKIAYLRGGTAWLIKIPLSIGVDLDSLQLSFLENAGTRGDSQGTIPVIRFTGPIPAGVHILFLTLKSFGQASMGLKSDATTSGDQSMMEMDWIIVS